MKVNVCIESSRNKEVCITKTKISIKSVVKGKRCEIEPTLADGGGVGKAIFVCQSPGVLFSTSLITHGSLGSRKKAEASQVKGQCSM